MQARRATGAPWKYSNVFIDQAELAQKVLPQVVHGGLEELPSPSFCQGKFRRCQHCLPCAADLGEAGSALLDGSAQRSARSRNQRDPMPRPNSD